MTFLISILLIYLPATFQRAHLSPALSHKANNLSNSFFRVALNTVKQLTRKTGLDDFQMFFALI